MIIFMTAKIVLLNLATTLVVHGIISLPDAATYDTKRKKNAQRGNEITLSCDFLEVYNKIRSARSSADRHEIYSFGHTKPLTTSYYNETQAFS